MQKSNHELLQKIGALQDRFSRLHSAGLRISASLDLDTVLPEIVDSARALTNARYGVIITVDKAGRPREFVTSGVTPDEWQQLVHWADGMLLFEHLRDLPGPVRVGDLPGYVRSLGLSTDVMPYKTMQGTPMRHRGMYVGSFFLADKKSGPEFTRDDEEILSLFASQAAAAIANAWTYRAEQRARADLEALVDTSPVGVVVFDARTGKPASLNREAKRIVEGLRMPDRSAEQLLEVLTCQRADGREIALAEFPLAQQWLNSFEIVRSEEIALSVPDGRKVKMLINATPIRAEDGKVESVVVTMQDLAGLEELERMRAQFLGMVSHELRTPLIAIKGSTATVLGSPAVLRPAEMLQFFRVIDHQADHMRSLIGDLLDQGRIEAGTLSVSPVPVEVADLVDEAKNTFLTGGGQHTIRIDLPQDLPRVMADRQRIVQVFSNLLSNAARHSAASSPIEISASRDGAQVAVSVADEGRGVPADRLPHLFRKYGDAKDSAPDRAGRGRIGLLVCKGLVEAHGGRIWAESEGVGRGTRFTFTVPVADEAGIGASAGLVGPSRSRSSRDAREGMPILVVDDDPRMLRYIRDALAEAGYAPLVTDDPQDLPALIRTHKPRLVLLDLVLPETDGIELMESISELAGLPVIFISVYGKDETIVRALNAGAADYIVKPFSPTELTARVHAALRRSATPEPFVSGELVIYYEQRQVSVAGRPVELTATEFEMLRVLSMNAGRVMTYDALLRQAWDGRYQGSGNPQLVRAVATRLRRKLGDDAASPSYIVNVRGVGYRMPGPGDL